MCFRSFRVTVYDTHTSMHAYAQHAPTHAYMYAPMHACTHVRMYQCMHIHTYTPHTYTNICTNVCMHQHMYQYTHAPTNTYMYAPTNAHMYTCTTSGRIMSAYHILRQGDNHTNIYWVSSGTVTAWYCWLPHAVRGAKPVRKKCRCRNGTVIPMSDEESAIKMIQHKPMLTASFWRSELSWPEKCKQVVMWKQGG